MLNVIADQLHPADRRAAVTSVLRQWLATKPTLSPGEFSAALIGAVATTERQRETFDLELAWTGPNTGVIPVRYTEQVLLELINGAVSSLTFVSYAVYRIAQIRTALVEAGHRNVRVRGIIDGDVIAAPHLHDICREAGP
jgi:hypothetical protein